MAVFPGTVGVDPEAAMLCCRRIERRLVCRGALSLVEVKACGEESENSIRYLLGVLGM